MIPAKGCFKIRNSLFFFLEGIVAETITQFCMKQPPVASQLQKYAYF